MGDYPEHEKLEAIQAQSQAIGEFLDTGGFILCQVADSEWMPYVPVSKPINEILADYFEIDSNKIEEEKRAMLAKMGGGS